MDDKKIHDEHTEEARQKWGHTEAYKQSEEGLNKMSKENFVQTLEDDKKLTEEIASCMKSGKEPASDEAQALIARHYNGLRAFYEPSKEIYRGLAKMYIEDERFKSNYEKFATGLAQFMHDAMMHFIDTGMGTK